MSSKSETVASAPTRSSSSHAELGKSFKLAKRCLNGRARPGNGGLCVGYGSCHAVKVMNHALVTGELHRHPGAAQRLGIGPAFIAERIEFCGMHVGGWQAGEVGGAQRRDPRIGHVLPRCAIVTHGPSQGRPVEEI